MQFVLGPAGYGNALFVQKHLLTDELKTVFNFLSSWGGPTKDDGNSVMWEFPKTTPILTILQEKGYNVTT